MVKWIAAVDRQDAFAVVDQGNKLGKPRPVRVHEEKFKVCASPLRHSAYTAATQVGVGGPAGNQQSVSGLKV